jgi:hypothetical protein
MHQKLISSGSGMDDPENPVKQRQQKPSITSITYTFKISPILNHSLVDFPLDILK